MENDSSSKETNQTKFAMLPTIYGITMLIISIVFIGSGSASVFLSIGSILLVLTPLLIGVVSIIEFARSGLAFGDRYSIMNKTCAFALCVLAIAEAILLIIQDNASNEIGRAMYYTVGSIGLLPWVASSVSYLLQTNEVLGFFSNSNLTYLLLICSILGPVAAILLLLGVEGNRHISTIIAIFPLLALIILQIITLGVSSWVFRKGQFIKPMLYASIGVGLMAIHFGLQALPSMLSISILSLLTGIVGYSFLGTYLLLTFAMIDRA